MESKASAARSYLEHMLVDETMQPKPFPLQLFEDITDDFSYDREIGSGGFAVVYKGILGDKAVAVKRISNDLMHETEFHREVECLLLAKHKNVVRFLGYCDDRQGNMKRYDGKFIMGDVHQRLLCFEYMPVGSLGEYIIGDAYRDWGTHYKIIKEICEGLQFLHENNIHHLDMKPANILLDNNMTPKITDFGLSRHFDESQSRHITTTTPGTLGYMAPEHIDEGVIVPSTDLYSLGVIIIEILTGQKSYQAIEDVLERWSGRLEGSQRDTQLEQIRVCYNIAYECKEFNPKDRPASAQNIIDKLHETESTQTVSKSVIGFLEVGILGAHDLAGMKNPYVVAKYDEKWVRTRTLLNTTAPKWNEQYTWDVFDQSTIIVVAVFDACHLSSHGGHDAIDQPIGKVRLSLAALETDRVYTQHYPLTASTTSPQLRLAVRFTRMSWPEIHAMYRKALLPKIQHPNPISLWHHVDLRPRAVAQLLERLEPQLRREVVDYMRYLDSQKRPSKVNFYRINSLLSDAVAIAKCLDDICKWKNPLMTILVLVVFLVSVCYPVLILPMVLLCMIMIGAWSCRRRPHWPPHMGELAEEFDTFPTFMPGDEVLMGSDRPRSVAGRLQAVDCYLYMHVERMQSLLSWRDPRATLVCITLFLVVVVILYLTPFWVVAMVMGLYLLRPPWFRGRSNLFFNLYNRLPFQGGHDAVSL